ncbi:phage tail assembly chaperone [Paraburkholderia sediminicola]|uniref:phage tail assembly chaperone n=1 Tax=Paraburkholderia sediminicola TaxID=458836 RepID=UPI0038BB866E
MNDTVEVGGHQYRIGRIDARKQFHVARRLAPLLAGMGGAPDRGEGFAAFLGPLSDALSGMSDEDVDYVLDACLGVCHRIQPSGHPAPVMTRSGLMFEDIDMGQMIQLAIKVIQENLGGFFPGAAAA